jgi:hypothetical protein
MKNIIKNLKEKLFAEKEVKKEHLLKHETKRITLIKFFFVLVLFLVYLLFVSLKYGLKNGFLIALLTWSFFVLCTPIADAGFLFDFPVRLLLKVKMIFSETLVWIFAISLNIYVLTFKSEIYSRTLLLKLFYFILTHPFPYWLIIILSFLGTFLSIYFADELLNVVEHKERLNYFLHYEKYKILMFLFLISFIILLYKFLLHELGVNIL